MSETEGAWVSLEQSWALFANLILCFCFHNWCLRALYHSSGNLYNMFVCVGACSFVEWSFVEIWHHIRMSPTYFTISFLNYSISLWSQMNFSTLTNYEKQNNWMPSSESEFHFAICRICPRRTTCEKKPHDTAIVSL